MLGCESNSEESERLIQVGTTSSGSDEEPSAGESPADEPALQSCVPDTSCCVMRTSHELSVLFLLGVCVRSEL